MPSPSSLIFVVIVLIWAAYLLQHWIRRREALATARSVDRFSTAMRILDRRVTLPVSGVAAMAVDGEQTRPSAPSVSVKPERISLRAGDFPMSVEPKPIAEEVVVEQNSTLLQTPVRVGSRVMRLLGRVDRRQVRGICLLVAVALLVVTTALAPFALVPWWSPIAMLLVTGGVIAWLRAAALKSQGSAGRRRPPVPLPAVRSSAQLAGGRRRPLQAPATPAAVDTVEPMYADPAYADATYSHPVYADPSYTDQGVFDVAPAVVVADQSSVVEVTPAGQWQPVQVPRPTYTMKEEAPRPVPAPAPVTPTSWDQVRVEDLPFDGMALEVDGDDDVRPVYRAG